MFETIISCRIATFTVDTAVEKVTIVPGDLANLETVYMNPLADMYFKAQENFLIKSLSFVLPYCFSLADQRAAIRVYYEKLSTGVNSSVSEIGSFGTMWFYSENVEQDLNVFVKWPSNLPTETALRFRATCIQQIGSNGAGPVTYPWISMVNAPAALHGVVLPVFSFMRILHTLPIQAVA